MRPHIQELVNLVVPIDNVLVVDVRVASHILKKEVTTV